MQLIVDHCGSNWYHCGFIVVQCGSLRLIVFKRRAPYVYQFLKDQTLY